MLRAFVSHETAPMRFRVAILTPTPGAKAPRVSALPSVAAAARRTSPSATVRTGASTFRTTGTERNLVEQRLSIVSAGGFVLVEQAEFDNYYVRFPVAPNREQP